MANKPWQGRGQYLGKTEENTMSIGNVPNFTVSEETEAGDESFPPLAIPFKRWEEPKDYITPNVKIIGDEG